MTTPCPSPLVRSAYADRELTAADAVALEAHLDSCAACRARIAALRAEHAALRALLVAAEPTAVPEFQRPLGKAGLALAGLGTLAVGVFASSVWGALGASVPPGLRWLSPFDSGALVDLFVSVLLFINNEGIAMLTSILQFTASAVLIVLIVLLASACAALLKPRAGTAVLLSALLVVAAFPRLSHALEIRRSEHGPATVAAGETIDDSLLAVGETVSIDGDVNGDLLAFARLVTIRGNVSGDVISAGETVEIRGNVGGNVFAAGRAVTLNQIRVGHNLYAAGRDVSVATGTEIAGNATAAGATVNIDGKIGVDVASFAENFALRGEVTRNVTALGQTVTLLAPAVVGGDLTARVGDLDKVQIASGATVRGNVDKQIVEAMRERAEASKYLRPSFYVWQLVRLGAAFLSGLVLLWLFPGLQTASLADTGAAVKAGVFGLVAAIALPVIALIACITVVGLPLGIIGAIVWLLGLYFAKIVVAQMIGRALFRSAHGVPHYAATLLAGLVIVIIAINLPWFIGGIFGLVLTLVGLGMLINYVSERSGLSL
jgi:cytoskeletal protein CcmA (bactofilin family)